jgi:hypothetical protein
MMGAISIDLVGWFLWFLLTHMLSKGGSRSEWVTWDYYISTALLGLSTVSTISGALLDQPALVGGLALPLALIGLTVLAVRALRGQKRSQASYTSDTQQVAVPAGKWTVREAPRATARPSAASMWTDPTIMDIEARRMPA